MQGLLVTLNGEKLASVSVEGLNILNVTIHGDLLSPELASLDMSGGYYGENEKDKHLLWLNDIELSQGDEVEIFLLETTSTLFSGKTVNEIYPDAKNNSNSQTMDELFEELSQETKTREKILFEVTQPNGKILKLFTSGNDSNFNFLIMWKWLHPEQASVSLTTNSLIGIRDREKGKQLSKFNINYGQSAKLKIST